MKQSSKGFIETDCVSVHKLLLFLYLTTRPTSKATAEKNMPCDSCEKLARLAEDACVISCCNSRFMDLYGGGGRGHNTSQNNFLICFVSGLECK